jgi:excisionase family DNA binding protein
MARPATLPHSQRAMLTEQDAAAYLSISYDLLCDLIHAGEVPLVRFTTPAGKEMKRVMRRDLDAFAERHRDRLLEIRKRGAA